MSSLAEMHTFSNRTRVRLLFIAAFALFCKKKKKHTHTQWCAVIDWRNQEVTVTTLKSIISL